MIRRPFLQGMGRRAVLIMVGLATVASVGVGPAQAICVGPREGGRWWNTNAAGDPISLEVTLDSCGDQVLNGQATETRYGLSVFVKQSTGALYRRPKAVASYRNSKGARWLYARVPTGGYLDHVWMRLYDSNGQTFLRVFIRHESLDSKPSATSDFWFRR